MPSGDDVGSTALRKAFWRLLPLLFLGYALAYVDRVNISFAALQMNKDLHFSATVYGLGGGLFFLSYACCEVPSNLLLLRFGARRWIARIMLTWGLIAAGMMFVKTPTQFYVMRLLLGAAEGGFFPGVVFYLTQWFPAAYRGRAISRFYFSSPISTAVMGAVAGPLLGLDGRLHLAGWQWLFLLEGVPAVLLAGVIFLCLADSPAEASWLTAAERDWLQNRLAQEASQAGRAVDRGFARALVDRTVLWLGLSNFFHFPRQLRVYAVCACAPQGRHAVDGGSGRARDLVCRAVGCRMHGAQRGSFGSERRALSARGDSAGSHRRRAPGHESVRKPVGRCVGLSSLLQRLCGSPGRVLAHPG